MAKKFKFRLEPLLNLKAFRAKQAKEALVEIMNIRLEKEKEIADKTEYLNALNSKKIKSSGASLLQAHVNHKMFVQSEIRKLTNERKQLLEIEDIKRKELTEKMKEEKIMSKLKDKKKEIHLQEALAEETKQLDEIATNKFNRK